MSPRPRHIIRSPVTATRNDVDIAESNSTTISRNQHFEQIKTDFKSAKYCACQLKWTFFTTSKKEQPLQRFCTSLTFCTFPDFRKSTRHAGENAAPKRTSPGQRSAQTKRKFLCPETTFLRACAVKTTAHRNLHLDLRGFTPTVRTPQCATLFGEKKISPLQLPKCGHSAVWPRLWPTVL